MERKPAHRMNITLPADVNEAMRVYCERHDIRMSHLIAKAVAKWIRMDRDDR